MREQLTAGAALGKATADGRTGPAMSIWVSALLLTGSILPEAHAQARLVFNNDAWVRIDNGAWVVLENPNPNAITQINGANLRSEGEFNRVRWQIRNTVGTYVLPYTSPNGVKMPFTYRVTTAGSNELTASVCFSTYNYAAMAIAPADHWNNFLYRPSDVLHLNSWLQPIVPNSDNAVDRFWIVDPGAAGYAYGTLPNVELDFTYDPNAANGEVRPGNFILPPSPVGAQRFNTTIGQWGDYMPAGTHVNGAPVSSVLTVPVPAADFFRSWTLANFLDPLPVELVQFNGTCEGQQVMLRWTTASESNSDHFRVERSADGTNWSPIGQVEAAGYSFTTLHYLYVDQQPQTLSYYRLVQVDHDGSERASSVSAAGCGGGGYTEIVNAWDDGYDLNVLVQAYGDQMHLVRLLDAGGKLVWSQGQVPLMDGLTTVRIPKEGIAPGIYVVRFDGPEGPMARRVPLFR